MDEELRFHIDQQTEQNLRAGMSAREAHRQAHIKFGGVERMKERTRNARGVRWLGDLGQDVRLALRTLLKDRGFAAVTVLTLAVAIGANTAIFSIVDAVLLNPLPYPDADEIVTLGLDRPGLGRGELGFSDRGYWHFLEKNRSFQDFGAYQSTELPLTGDGEPTQLSVGVMTNGAYAVLGVPALRGRLPGEEEDIPGGPLVTVLSYELWAMT